MVMQRGEVWWADLGERTGTTRPVLLLTRSEGIQLRANVTVAPVTTQIRGIPSEVNLGPDEGLPRKCVADLDSLQTISRSLLRDRVAKLSSGKLVEVEEAIRFSLNLSHQSNG